MKNSKKILLAGTVLASVSALNANSNNFHFASDLGSGTDLRTNLLADFNSIIIENNNLIASVEAKCGEGKCGEKSTNTKTESTEKSTEGKCGEGKCGEGKCGEKAETKTDSKSKTCGATSTKEINDKTSESKCGEGKCGEGKCGSK